LMVKVICEGGLAITALNACQHVTRMGRPCGFQGESVP